MKVIQCLLAAGLMAGPLAANAQLTAVTRDGVTLINDAALNVTWVADASLSGFVFWSKTHAAGSAQAWIDGLNIKNYGGFSDWSLPTGDGSYTATSCGLGCGYGSSTDGALNQLGYLFINELGNAGASPITNTGPGSVRNLVCEPVNKLYSLNTNRSPN
jgi:hypothetical protein